MNIDIDVVDETYKAFKLFEDEKATALELYLYAKKLELIASAIKENTDIKDKVIELIKEEGGEIDGGKLNYSVRTNYQYDFELYKAVEKFLKQIKEDSYSLLDNDSEIMVTFNGKKYNVEKPKLKSKTEVVSVTLDKKI